MSLGTIVPLDRVAACTVAFVWKRKDMQKITYIIHGQAKPLWIFWNARTVHDPDTAHSPTDLSHVLTMIDITFTRVLLDISIA